MDLLSLFREKKGVPASQGLRLGLIAVDVRTFTVGQLHRLTGIPENTIYGFLHDLRKADQRYCEEETLPAVGRGRPRIRYTLTAEGVVYLQGRNSQLAAAQIPPDAEEEPEREVTADVRPVAAHAFASHERKPPPWIIEPLRLTVEQGATCLYLKAGEPPLLKLSEGLKPLHGEPRLDKPKLISLADELMTPVQEERFRREGSVTLAFSLPTIARFRTQLSCPMDDLILSFHPIPDTIPTVTQPEAREALERMLEPRNGLILVVGLPGVGKSPMATIVDSINASCDARIVTIEDPVEYIHSRKRALISQFEVGVNAASFAQALETALAEQPDVLMIDELAHAAVVKTALAVAKTNLLVVAGVSAATDVGSVIEKLLLSMPAAEEPQVRSSLASALRGIIWLRSGGRVGPRHAVFATLFFADDRLRACFAEPSKTSWRDSDLHETAVAGALPANMLEFMWY